MRGTLRLLLLFSASLFAVACNDAGTNPFLQTDVAINANAGDVGSNNGVCLGCVAAGECFNGDESSACGAGGGACVACPAEEVCGLSGLCIPKPSCGRDSCAGCCDASGECQIGGDVGACGVAGLACSVCPAGGSCQNGTCRQPCSPDTCSGCCDASGVCIVGTADASCGAAGVACVDCAPDACSAGQCVASSCADSCAGCCDGATCVMAPTAGQCGASGVACLDCGVGRTCGGQGCEVDPDSLWDAFVGTGEVGATDSAGDSWDGFNGLPDPFVNLSTSDPQGGDFTGGTSSVDDSLTPSWDETVLTQVPARALFDGLTIELRDSDTTFDDVICDIVVPLTPRSDAFGGGIVESTCGPDPALGKVRWRLLPSP